MDTLENKHLVLIGFNTDYQRLEVEEISKQWSVYDLRMNFILYFLCSKLIKFDLTKKIVTQYYKYRKKNIPKSKYKVIVTDDPIDIHGVRAFQKKDVKILMRNSILGDYNLLKLISDYSVYSFDPRDCERYGFYTMKQFIPCSTKIQSYCDTSDIIDFYFLGLDKGRADYLTTLENTFNDFGFKTKFLVKSSPIGLCQKLEKWIKRVPKYKMLSYEDNLRNVSQCKCIVEWVQEGQSGITLRTLEAIFFGKKLITNNKWVIDSELFVANNILYVDSLSEIKQSSVLDFFNQPYLHYPSSTLEDYKVTDAINKMLLKVSK